MLGLALLTAGLTLPLWIGLFANFALGLLIPIGYEELARKPSPDGRLDAVLYTLDAGATTSVAYCVGIVESGDRPDDPDISAEHVDEKDMEIKWRDNQTLLARLPANEFFHQRTRVEIDGRTITILLQKTMRSGAVQP